MTVSKLFGWYDVRDYDSTVATGGDDTAKIQGAIDRALSANNGDGCMVVLGQRPQNTYTVEGTIDVHGLVHLMVPAGTIVHRPAGTGNPKPLARLAGGRARITGEGLFKTDDDHPEGIIKFGPEGFTHSSSTAVSTGGTTVTDESAPFGTANVGDSFSIKCAGQPFVNTTITAVNSPTSITVAAPLPACDPAKIFWLSGTPSSCVQSHVRDVRIEGVEAPGNIGILMQSAPQGGNFGTFGNLVRDTWVRWNDTAIMIDAQANANFIRDPFCRDSLSNVNYMKNSDESSWHGGFVQSSPGATMVRLEDVFASSTWQLHAEPGGTAFGVNIDAACQDNVVHIMDNLSNFGTDNGLRTTLWLRNRLSFGPSRMGFYDGPAINQPATNADIHTTGLAAAP